MRNFILCLLISTCLFYACSKQLQEKSKASNEYISLTNSDIETAFQEFEDEMSDGDIIIQDNHFFNLNDTLRQVSILGGTGTEDLASGPLSVNSIQISKVHGDSIFEGYLQQDEPDLFGTNITVGLGTSFQTITFYSPKRIFASSEGAEIEAGNIITWNPDTANQNKILIKVDFEPVGQQDTTFTNFDPISRQLVTEDDGSYALESALLDGIPQGALFTIRVIRGNYGRIYSLDESHNYSVYSFSKTYGGFIMK